MVNHYGTSNTISGQMPSGAIGVNPVVGSMSSGILGAMEITPDDEMQINELKKRREYLARRKKYGYVLSWSEENELKRLQNDIRLRASYNVVDPDDDGSPYQVSKNFGSGAIHRGMFMSNDDVRNGIHGGM